MQIFFLGTEGTEVSLKVKGKVRPRTGQEGPEGEQRNTSTVSLTLVLDGVGGQGHASAALSPGKRPAIHFLRGWMGPRIYLDGCGKPSLPRNSIPGPSRP
jgi:hypothetical protein